MTNKITLKDIQSQQTYEAIRVATQEIIEEKGVENLTIREICKRTNISIGTFYNYFSSKEDLIVNRYKSIDVYFVSTVEPLLNNEDEWQNLCQFAQSYGFFTENYASLEFSRKLLQARLSIERDVALNKDRPLYKILNNIFLRGQDKDIFRKDLYPMEMAEMMMVLLRGYHYESVLRMDKSYLLKAMKVYFPIWAQCFLLKNC